MPNVGNRKVVAVHHFSNPLDLTSGYEFMEQGGAAAAVDGGAAVYIDVGESSQPPQPVQRERSSKSINSDYLSLDSISGNLGVAARRDALEAQYLDIARRESSDYLEVAGSPPRSNSKEQLVFPVAGTPSKQKASRGGLLATIRNPVWFGFAVIILMIFSITLFAIGVTFVYAERSDGWDNTNFGAVGAYAGVPLLAFGVAFLVATLFAAKQFYKKHKNSGTSGRLPQVAMQSRQGSRQLSQLQYFSRS